MTSFARAGDFVAREIFRSLGKIGDFQNRRVVVIIFEILKSTSRRYPRFSKSTSRRFNFSRFEIEFLIFRDFEIDDFPSSRYNFFFEILKSTIFSIVAILDPV